MSTIGIKQCILKAKESGFVWADVALAELENITKDSLSFVEQVKFNQVTWDISND